MHPDDGYSFSGRELAARLALPHKLHHGLRSGGFGDVRRHPDRLASDRTLSQNSAMVLLTISTYASKVPIGETPATARL